MHASLRSHGQSLRELRSLLVEHLPRGTNAALQRLEAQQDVNLHHQRCFAQASDRDRQAQRVPDPKAQDLESLSRGKGGGVMGGGGGSVRGSQGGVLPWRIFRFQPADFPADFFLADLSFAFCDQKKFHRKIHRSVESSCFRNPPALRHQKFTGLPPPQGEQIQLLCVRVWDRHFSGWEFPGKDSRFNWTSEPQNPYRKNRCGMAMHGVPCSMSY